MQIIKNILTIIKKSSRYWLPVLFALVLMRLCATPATDQPVEPQRKLELAPAETGKIKSYDQLENEYMQALEQQETPSPLTTYLWMTGLVALVFLIQRRNLLPYMLPSKIWSMGSVRRIDGGLDNYYRVRLLNHSKTNQTASEPVIVFSNLAHKRVFRLQLNEFPLVLTPQTAHGFTLSLAKFVEAHPELKKFPFVHVEIKTGERRKSRTLPSWVRWKN